MDTHAAWLPMLVFGVCTWVMAAMTVLACETWSASSCMMLAVCSAVAGLGVVALFARNGARLMVLGVLGCCAGVMLASSASARLHTSMEDVNVGSAQVVALQALEDSREGDFGSWCMAHAMMEDGSRLRVRVNMPQGATVDCWQVMEVKALVRAPSDMSRASFWRKGCSGSISIREVEACDPPGPLRLICTLRRAGIAYYRNSCEGMGDASSKGLVLLEAILFGSRRDLFATELYQDVKVCGLAHIVAVSGAHLVIVSGILASCLHAMRVSRRIALSLQSAFVFAYVAFTGMPISALRAAIMSTCAFSSFYAGRRASPITALVACVMAMMAVDPFLALSLSLALSCSASLGIVLFSQSLCTSIDRALHGRMRFASKALSATLAANVTTVPLSASVFSQIPLIAPISNLVVVPAVAFIVSGGLLLAAVGLTFPLDTAPMARLLVSFTQVLCELVHNFAKVPYACITASMSTSFACAMTILLTICLRRIRKVAHGIELKLMALGAVGATAFVVAVLPVSHGCEIVMLDVGQGDAIAYRHGPHTVLVDTGTEDAQVLAALARHDIRSLDAIVVSHADDDHCGSLAAIASVIPVGRVCVAADLLTCDCASCRKLRSQMEGLAVEPLAAGDLLQFDRFTMRVLAPHRFHDQGGNADSLVLEVGIDCDGDELADWKAFTSGDAEACVLDDLATRGLLHHADIVKVPHHGSAAALDDCVLDALTPQIALIGVGECNRYGHPSEDTLEQLQSHGITTYRSDMHGDVVCCLTQKAVKVHCLG